MTQAANDRISVIIPTHNRAHLLGRAVRSVWAQGERGIELIVVDDNSSDDTDLIIQKLSQSAPITYVKNLRPRGPSGARNSGLEIATGSFFAFLDSDDEWRPDHLSGAVTLLKEHEEIDVVFGDFSVVNDETKEHLFDFFDRKPVLRNLPKMSLTRDAHKIVGDLFGALIKENSFNLGTCVVRRAKTGAVRFSENSWFGEDRDYAIRLLLEARANFGVLSTPRLVHYVHSGNLTSTTLEAGEKESHDDLMMFMGYLKRTDVSPGHRTLLRARIVERSLALAYFSRSLGKAARGAQVVFQSFAYGVTVRQIVELLKCLYARALRVRFSR